MEWGQQIISSTVQCWSCPVFDRMFQIISQASKAAYEKMYAVCIVLFLVIFAFYIFGAVWKNLTSGFSDGWFDKSVRPVFINSIFALSFLALGPILPRFITQVTFEPVAYVTQTYATAIVNRTPEQMDTMVSYTTLPMGENSGIFRPELRDTIINIAKVTITQFQAFMGLGIAMLDAAFSWSMFLGIGAVIKHLILAIIGAYLFWSFFKMFFKFLCYFADVIIAMAMFAFFFPFSLLSAAFQDAKDVPTWLSWIKSLGKTVGVEQIKNMISAIISLGAAVITYTVILVIIATFFTDANNTNQFAELMNAIQNGSVFENDLNTSTMNDLTLASVVVLVYVLTFIYDNIPNVTKSILGMFEVSESDNAVGKAWGDDLMTATKGYANKIKTVAKTIIKHGKKA